MGTKHWRGEHRKKGRHVPKERMTRACSPELEVAGNWNPLCQQERLFLNFPSWGHPCQSGFTKGFYTWKKVRRSQSDVFFCRQFMGTKVVAIFNCGALMERRVKPLGHLETACKHKADKWHHKVLERQNFFSYKLVLSDIISLPIAKQREQVVVEPIDRINAVPVQYIRQSARPCAQRKPRPHLRRLLIVNLAQNCHLTFFVLWGKNILQLCTF